MRTITYLDVMYKVGPYIVMNNHRKGSKQLNLNLGNATVKVVNNNWLLKVLKVKERYTSLDGR